MSNNYLESYDLIDLLSERHNLMRGKLEATWNDISEIHISNTEWYILSKVYQNSRPPLSSITKHVNISRQAIHKQVKNLEAKGLIEMKNVEYNKKEKCVQMTVLGEECYEKYEKLKAQLESKIAASIGEEQMNVLKNLLKKDWKV